MISLIKRILLICFLFFLTLEKGFSQCICDEALKPVYDILEVHTERDYLATLHTIYNLEESAYNAHRSNTGFNLIFPEYGSADYKKNKQTVNSTYRKYSSETSVLLSENEKQGLIKMTVNENIQLKAYDAYMFCIAKCSKSPSGTLNYNSTSSIIASVELPVTPYNAKKKTEILDINYSSGLSKTPDQTTWIGDKLGYGTSYSFKFSRTSYDNQSIIINLEKESTIKIPVPAISDPNQDSNQDPNPPCNPPKIELSAKGDFKVVAGNIGTLCGNYGGPMLRNCDGIQQRNAVKWSFHAPCKKTYDIWATFTSGESRPMMIFIDNTKITDNAFNQTTGGFQIQTARRLEVLTNVEIDPGYHEFLIDRNAVMPHIVSIELIPKN